MSWFNMESLQDGLAQVQTAMHKIEIPHMDKNMFEKLTLTTPELTEQRQRIDAEERRKEAVRDMLAGMMPWETRDTERDILVEECKEAVLKLSTDKETFFGPYPMPNAVKLGNKKKEEGEEEEDDEDNVESEDPDDEETTAKDHKPSKESLEMLEKLEPLPPLLQDFDLDSHVGLIQKLLKLDPRLVGMQSKLSGGGEREKVFWRNYFFHCANARYEAGLSIDEIWCEDQQKSDKPDGTDADQAEAKTREETITFDNADEKADSEKKAFPAEPVTDTDAPFSTETEPISEVNDFEMVAGDDDGGADDNVVDYELDALEAEIARELEE